MEDIEQSVSVVSVITRMDNSLQVDLAGLTEWLVSLAMNGYRSPGFWSGEILPPGRAQNIEWTGVLRFQSMEEATGWQQSAARQKILAQFESITGADKAHVVDEVTTDAKIGSSVTAIVTNVKPKMEEEYWQWEYKIQRAQAKFPGYGGVYVQPPPPGKPGQWTTLLRFDSPKALENWFDAKERKEILAEANKFVSGLQYHKIESSFPGWLPGDGEGRKGTPSWKGATMVVVGLFPILLLLKKFFNPLVATLPPIAGMAMGTVLCVCTVSFVTMPILVKLFNWWLAPDEQHATLETDLTGFLIALAVFACEIAMGMLIG